MGLRFKIRFLRIVYLQKWVVAEFDEYDHIFVLDLANLNNRIGNLERNDQDTTVEREALARLEKAVKLAELTVRLRKFLISLVI